MPESPTEGSELRIKVRYFASIREHTGVNVEEFEVQEGATVEIIIMEAKRLHPQLRTQGGCIFASVNGDFVNPSRRLESGDDVALFPPVSGG